MKQNTRKVYPIPALGNIEIGVRDDNKVGTVDKE